MFAGDDDKHLIALDARTGKHLWHFNVGQTVNASPVTWARDGKQYVTIVSLTDVLTFGLFETAKPGP